MNISIFSGVDLMACRVCLATNAKLFNLQKSQLIQTYFEFSGTPIMATDGLPQYICVFCYALLKKSSEFRNKCKNAYTVLLKHLLQIPALTTSYIETLGRTDLKTSLTLSETNITSIPEDDINIDETVSIKEELQTAEDPINLNNFDENSRQDYEGSNFENDNMKSKDESFITLKSEYKNKITKKKRKKKEKLPKGEKSAKESDDRIKEFQNKYLNNITDKDRKAFYDHILEKYVKNNKKQNKNNIIDSPNIQTEDIPLFISIDNGNITENSKTEMDTVTEVCNTTRNLYQKRLYQHIIEKYSKKSSTPTNQEKITDVTRMRERKPEKRNSTKTKDDLAAFSNEYNVDVAVLSKEQQIQDVLSRKETDKYKKAKFKCEDCYRGFSTEKAFQNHKAIHDPSTGLHECDICRIRFAKSEARRKHVQLRHKHTYTCRMCGQVSRNSTCAREHYKCHAGFSYVCEHCGKIFSKYASRINHIRIFHGSVICGVCHESFAGEAGLTAHKTKAHRELFKCVTCGVQFHNSDALRRHAEALQGEVCGAHVRPCTQCGDNFNDEESMTQHMNEYHNKRKPRGRTQSKRTIKLVPNPKPSVRWRARRTPRPPAGVHAVEHKKGAGAGGDAPHKFMCEMCAADGFNSEAVLRYHQRIHTGERPHPCPRCPKRFRIKELLQAHVRTHTGARPYACARCPKAFKTASQLHTHQTVHTKLRRHRCHICDKAFLTSTCVNTHVRTVHMKLPTRRHALASPQQLHSDQ